MEEVILTPYRAHRMKTDALIFDAYKEGLRIGSMAGPLKQQLCERFGMAMYGLDSAIKREAVRRGIVADAKPIWKVSMNQITSILKGGK